MAFTAVAGAATGAILGGFLGGSGGGGSSQSGSATSSSTATPWAGALPYLQGQKSTTLKSGVTPTYDANGNQNNPASDYTPDTPGVLPSAATNYTNAAWTPGMAANNTAQQNYTSSLINGNAYNPVTTAANKALSGGFDPTITAAGNVNAQSVDPTQAFASLGSANPQGSLSQMLTGQANTSTLDPVVQNALTRMSDNFNTSVLPQINDGAVAAGQYGSSRQGIAQGLAAKSLAQAQGDTAANMYNSAYNQAQQNMYGTANNLSGLSLNNSTNNANRDLTAQTTNVNTQLQNNAQQMALQNQNLNNALQGTNLLNSGIAGNNALYNQQQSNMNSQNAYNNTNLTNYANLVNPTAGMGGTQINSNPLYTNQTANAIGGAMLGNSLLSSSGSGIGNSVNNYLTRQSNQADPSFVGPIYDSFSDIRMKENISKVGVLPSGLNIYKFEYKPEFKDIAGHGEFIGVMAQEAEKVIPESVVTKKNGFKAVKYNLIH